LTIDDLPLRVLVVNLPAAFGGPFFGEVEAGKLAEALDGLSVAGACGLDLVVEIAE
jgi:hypothetical protein